MPRPLRPTSIYEIDDAERQRLIRSFRRRIFWHEWECRWMPWLIVEADRDAIESTIRPVLAEMEAIQAARRSTVNGSWQASIVSSDRFGRHNEL